MCYHPSIQVNRLTCYYYQQYYQQLCITHMAQHHNLTFNETFQSSLVQKNTEKFTIDRQLIKGIKQNDVSKIIDQNQLRGGAESLQAFNQLQQLSTVVKATRKRYDERKSESARLQSDIEKLKNEKQLLMGNQYRYNGISTSNKKSLQSIENHLQEVTALMESTLYRKDIYDYMKDNIKKDLLVLRKRHLDLDVRLMRNRIKLRTVMIEHESKVKLSKRCKLMLNSVEKSVNQKQLESRNKIQSFCDVLNRKHANQQNRQLRQQQIQQATISAMTDKLSEQKQWLRILNTNLLFKAILKSKMQALMGKYTNIQLSFHKMKQETCIKDSNEFIQKFLTRQETYGMLLSSIAEKQKLLEDLKDDREQLDKIYSNNMYKNQQMHEEEKNILDQNCGEGYNYSFVLHQLNEEILLISRQQQMIYQWGIRFLSAFNAHNTRDQMLHKYPKTQRKQLFLQSLRTIHQFLETLQKQQNHAKKIQQAFLKNSPKSGKIMNDDMMERNTRVKTLSTLDVDGKGDTFEEKDMAYDDLSEADYLQHHRRAIKKSEINRRFRIKTKPN